MTFEHTGLAPADILLPNCNLSKWSVIACDQYTAQVDYWHHVRDVVGDAPSSFHLILPEALLHERDAAQSAARIHDAMRRYLDAELFYPLEQSMIYVERQVSGGVRHGLVCCLDLEEYDYSAKSRSLIRASEEVVEDRVPPRIAVRENAPLELPHSIILIDDTARPLIAPFAQRTQEMEKLYGFSLMEGGGRIDGWRVDDTFLTEIADTLHFLRSATDLLFAVGDGNHSLSAAKALYERDKARTPKSEWASLPSRYTLVEVVSLRDSGMTFLPIHRIVFGADIEKLRRAFFDFYPDAVSGEAEGHTFCLCGRDRRDTLTVRSPAAPSHAQTLQKFLDSYVAEYGGSIDYIHDLHAVEELSRQTRAAGFLLPDFSRDALFPYLKKYGPLPRKTFSIGTGCDKRYYLEARLLRR